MHGSRRSTRCWIVGHRARKAPWATRASSHHAVGAARRAGRRNPQLGRERALPARHRAADQPRGDREPQGRAARRAEVVVVVVLRTACASWRAVREQTVPARGRADRHRDQGHRERHADADDATCSRHELGATSVPRLSRRSAARASRRRSRSHAERGVRRQRERSDRARGPKHWSRPIASASTRPTTWWAWSWAARSRT